MKLKLFDPKKDAFDEIEDAFSGVELPPDEKIMHSPAFKEMIEKAVQKAVAAIKLPEAPPAPPKETIREIRVEAPKDTRKLVEQSALDAALKKIADLEKELEETDRRARSPIVLPGGSGVIGIPDPGQATDGHVLTIETGSDGKKAKFKASSGGSGLSGYSVSNGTTDRTFDANDTSLDELADIVATIISDLS